MTVENIGAEEERMPSPGQSPLGSSGTEHRLAVCRWQRLRPARPAITLPPGESGEMTIVYDVPVDTEPDHMLIRGRTVLNGPVRLGPRDPLGEGPQGPSPTSFRPRAELRGCVVPGEGSWCA
ncbi:hypothetical protein [Nocardiopsis metallicus]|uniref:Uncharacterized protein n=1 Tax=Nocardiopsis metallicus TaxID=179819 RepID=A0A840WD44_9ACTN|nr:hypothetical protein [Nocardiopsis metallicus]MBB5489667.1 hypothetical protein [Nocardiopsis metallicus]